jgi:large conductance mechanosensitive channel
VDIHGHQLLLGLGIVIQVVFDFLIIAFSMFIVIKAMNVAKRKREKEAEAEKPAIVEEPKDLELLSEIRDLLRKS